MTGFFSYCNEDIVIVAMDTLVTCKDHTPTNIVSKIIPLLHSRSLICPMGDIDLAFAAFEFIEKNIICQDVSSLVHYFNFSMSSFIKMFKERYSYDPNGTLYIFGYNVINSVYESYKIEIRGTVGQVSKCEYGYMARPGEGIVDPENYDLLVNPHSDNFMDLFIEAIREMKRIDDERPKDKKWGIGGHCQVCLLREQGYHLVSSPMADFEKTYGNVVNKSMNGESTIDD